MNLPTESQCLELFRQYRVPPHIFEHCLSVSKLALFLAQKFKDNGGEINVELAHRTALLHDLFKVVSLNELKPNPFYPFSYSPEEIAMWQKLRQQFTNLHECQVAYLVLKKDFPGLASSIRNASNPLKKNKSPEELIAHYADWRILNNQIVSLAERLFYLQKRYIKGEEYWKKRAEIISREEKMLFALFKFPPEKLAQEVGKTK